MQTLEIQRIESFLKKQAKRELTIKERDFLRNLISQSRSTSKENQGEDFKEDLKAHTNH